MEEHPESFEEAKAYEKTAVAHGSPFTWSEGESLEELSQPKRVAQIRQEHARRISRLRERQLANPLRTEREPIDLDVIYGSTKVCLACHK
jgi:hypothetical protein